VKKLASLLAVIALATACQGDDEPEATTTTTVTVAPAGTPRDGTSDFDRIPQIVDEVRPSVVSVVTDGGQGSGVVYDADGWIITNHHVIAGAQDVEVVFADGNTADATVKASTDRFDIAVLDVEQENLPEAEFAPSLPVVGTLALAIGNPGGFENSVTQGIVSGLHRDIPAGGSTPALVDLIQTDAAISPGNSGGALVDDEGKIIGINVAYLPPQEGAVALGFAIPAPVATEVAQQLIDTGKVAVPYLGIEPAQVTPELASAFDLDARAGVLVASVADGGPAAVAGVEKGDVVVELDDRKVALVEDLFAELRDHDPGEEVTLTVVRGDDRQRIDVTLGEAGS
jgi:serine protease DegQ